jgi:DNA-binding MurR/RpiR family transcriptional regulator
MSYEERIRRERAGMSRSFAKLADFLLDSYVEASFMTASELAHALNLDAATVVRFSQSLGYRGFPQLQREVRQKVKTDLLISPGEAAARDSLPGIAAGALNDISRDLEQTRISLDTGALAALVERIGTARRIIILADATAQPAAYNLCYFLEQGGFPIYIASPAPIDLARTVHTASSQDLFLAIDIAGHTRYIANALRELKTRGIPTAAVVGAASLPSARAAEVVLAAQSHLSVASGMIVVNSLVYVLAEALRWRYNDRYAGADKAINELDQRIQDNG